MKQLLTLKHNKTHHKNVISMTQHQPNSLTTNSNSQIADNDKYITIQPLFC